MSRKRTCEVVDGAAVALSRIDEVHFLIHIFHQVTILCTIFFCSCAQTRLWLR
eukprot:SAG11_NODE_32639_length_282_cov_0.420765_1_plen_52_part_10